MPVETQRRVEARRGGRGGGQAVGGRRPVGPGREGGLRLVEDALQRGLLPSGPRRLRVVGAARRGGGPAARVRGGEAETLLLDLQSGLEVAVGEAPLLAVRRRVEVARRQVRARGRGARTRPAAAAALVLRHVQQLPRARGQEGRVERQQRHVQVLLPRHPSRRADPDADAAAGQRRQPGRLGFGGRGGTLRPRRPRFSGGGRCVAGRPERGGPRRGLRGAGRPRGGFARLLRGAAAQRGAGRLRGLRPEEGPGRRGQGGAGVGRGRQEGVQDGVQGVLVREGAAPRPVREGVPVPVLLLLLPGLRLRLLLRLLVLVLLLVAAPGVEQPVQGDVDGLRFPAEGVSAGLALQQDRPVSGGRRRSGLLGLHLGHAGPGQGWASVTRWPGAGLGAGDSSARGGGRAAAGCGRLLTSRTRPLRRRRGSRSHGAAFGGAAQPRPPTPAGG